MSSTIRLQFYLYLIHTISVPTISVQLYMYCYDYRMKHEALAPLWPESNDVCLQQLLLSCFAFCLLSCLVLHLIYSFLIYINNCVHLNLKFTVLLITLTNWVSTITVSTISVHFYLYWVSNIIIYKSYHHKFTYWFSIVHGTS